MSDTDRGSPVQAALVVLLIVGGGWVFFRHFNVEGLDQVSVRAKSGSDADEADSRLTGYRESSERPGSGAEPEPATTRGRAPETGGIDGDGGDSRLPRGSWFGFTASRRESDRPSGELPTEDASPRRYDAIRVATWALDGLGPTKFARELARTNLVRLMRRYDVIAVQQIDARQRDLVPRLADALNEGETRYDFVLGRPTGPEDRTERLAFFFDTTRVEVDRTQTYVVADPDDQLTYDPLVAWFRAAQPPANQAWTFTLVNVRIDLARAADELNVLKDLFGSVRRDGRGEDDVIVAGLLQADDGYLIPTLGGGTIAAVVTDSSTDVYGRHQTCNLLLDRMPTTEFIGRGGSFDFLRQFNLDLTEAEAVTSHLPVWGEFTATEVGEY